MDVMQFLGKHVFLVALAATTGGMLLWPLLRGSGANGVDTLKATLLINQQNALILDVRNEAEFATGHIINARNMPLARLADADMADKVSKRKDRAIIVCCATGNRSSAAVAALKKMGFTNATNLSGGLGAWKQAGLPTER